jgi:hypothetical protein
MAQLADSAPNGDWRDQVGACGPGCRCDRYAGMGRRGRVPRNGDTEDKQLGITWELVLDVDDQGTNVGGLEGFQCWLRGN